MSARLVTFRLISNPCGQDEADQSHDGQAALEGSQEGDRRGHAAPCPASLNISLALTQAEEAHLRKLDKRLVGSQDKVRRVGFLASIRFDSLLQRTKLQLRPGSKVFFWDRSKGTLAASCV